MNIKGSCDLHFAFASSRDLITLFLCYLCRVVFFVVVFWFGGGRLERFSNKEKDKEINKVRICGDYKITVNKVCKGDNHPIPRIEDLAYALSGGDKFTKLDLSHAYTQLQLDEESRKYTTINTHKGLFTYHRLCFGISAAPGIF